MGSGPEIAGKEAVLRRGIEVNLYFKLNNEGDRLVCKTRGKG